MDFDKRILFNNITYLLKKQEKKVGEFEKEVDVSTGYISRTSKDENSKPGIDFVAKASEVLNVSIDTLVYVDMTELTATENYYMVFIQKLISDTQQERLDWEKETEAFYRSLEPDINGNCGHPLFSEETFYRTGMGEYPDQVTEVVFVSDSFGCNTIINGDCYCLGLKNRSKLYLMDVGKDVYTVGDPNVEAKEIWMFIPGEGNRLICRSNDGSPIAPMVDMLFTEVGEVAKHPCVKGELKKIIDAYLKDDISDDYDDMPF